MVWRRVLWSFATIAVIVGVVLGLNHAERCKLSSPPQCGYEGPRWAMIGSAFAVATCFFVAGLVLTAVGRRRGTQQGIA
jgi:hypothetical protein